MIFVQLLFYNFYNDIFVKTIKREWEKESKKEHNVNTREFFKNYYKIFVQISYLF